MLKHTYLLSSVLALTWIMSAWSNAYVKWSVRVVFVCILAFHTVNRSRDGECVYGMYLIRLPAGEMLRSNSYYAMRRRWQFSLRRTGTLMTWKHYLDRCIVLMAWGAQST